MRSGNDAGNTTTRQVALMATRLRSPSPLPHPGFTPDTPMCHDAGRTIRHIHFVGLDRDPSSNVAYTASVPADSALDPRRDVLLAYEMNGAPLTRCVTYRAVECMATRLACVVMLLVASRSRRPDAITRSSLCRDHGFPVRAIVPGIVAARQVKWLGRIVLSPQESNSLWQAKDYKAFAPGVEWDTVDFESMPAIQVRPLSRSM